MVFFEMGYYTRPRRNAIVFPSFWRFHVDGRKWFKYATCGRVFFRGRKKSQFSRTGPLYVKFRWFARWPLPYNCLTLPRPITDMLGTFPTKPGPVLVYINSTFSVWCDNDDRGLGTWSVQLPTEHSRRGPLGPSLLHPICTWISRYSFLSKLNS